MSQETSEPLVVRAWFVGAFRLTANSLVRRYGAPIYLVGSALDSVYPRDIDLRIILEDAEMARFYGTDFPLRDEGARDYLSWEWRRARDCIKQSRALSKWGGIPIDFQVQSEMEALAYKDKERVRLDTAPDWVFSLKKETGGE